MSNLEFRVAAASADHPLRSFLNLYHLCGERERERGGKRERERDREGEGERDDKYLQDRT